VSCPKHVETYYKRGRGKNIYIYIYLLAASSWCSHLSYMMHGNTKLKFVLTVWFAKVKD